jgi:hypothetical protein
MGTPMKGLHDAVDELSCRLTATEVVAAEERLLAAIRELSERSVDPPLIVFTPDPVVVPLKAVESVRDMLRALNQPQTAEEARIRRLHLVGLFEACHCAGVQSFD